MVAQKCILQRSCSHRSWGKLSASQRESKGSDTHIGYNAYLKMCDGMGVGHHGATTTLHAHYVALYTNC